MMKIRHNPYRGTASIEFGLGAKDDAAFKAWMREAEKPGVNLLDAAQKVGRKRGVKTQITTAPMGADDDEG